MAKCVCTITGDGISGVIYLHQASATSPTVIKGSVKGLPRGKHGISINVFGDLSDGFRKCGPHYNPFSQKHGSPESNNRHVGSLGNITSDGDKADFYLEDAFVKVVGPYSVIGRSIVIYENEDDLGMSSNKGSNENGNAGIAIAGGVIGIANIVD